MTVTDSWSLASSRTATEPPLAPSTGSPASNTMLAICSTLSAAVSRRATCARLARRRLEVCSASTAAASSTARA